MDSFLPILCSVECLILLSLYLPLDDFFENVMVNADDESVRNNRLALMTEIQELFLKVADISQMAT